MLVSVAIGTKNEEKNIENCLKSIKGQTYPQDQIEIVIVDSNNTTDRTAEIARKYTDNVFEKGGTERSAQRNLAVEKCHGDYFLYLDADMTLDKNVISDCVKKVKENNEIVGLYISEIVTGERFFSKVRRFERSFYDATIVDCVRFIKKESFQKVGGFDEKLVAGEDWDLNKKLKKIGKLELLKTPIFHNESEFELGAYLKKKAYYSNTMDDYIAKWGKDDPDLKKQLGFGYRFFGIFVENGKWKKIVTHPLLTFGMYFLRISVGAVFILRKK